VFVLQINDTNIILDNSDFEDAIQEFSAINSGIEVVVTRNAKDSKNSKLHVLEPTQFNEWIKDIV